MFEKHLGLVLMEGRRAVHGLSPLLVSLVPQTTLINAMVTW